MNIDIRNLSQGYGQTNVIHDISFTAESGKITAVLGSNGCGKSTLIKTLAGILPCKPDTVFADGRDITAISRAERAKMVGYVPQYFHYTAYTSVLDTVLIGRRPYMSWSVDDEDLDAVDAAMEIMHVADLSERYINELSGGQRQRVFIARALAQNPAFYLFDEPTSSLDLRHQMETFSVIRGIMRKNNAGMIVAVHDLNLALRFADAVVLMKDGTLIDTGTPEDVLTPENVAKVYRVAADIVDAPHGRFIQTYDALGPEGELK